MTGAVLSAVAWTLVSGGSARAQEAEYGATADGEGEEGFAATAVVGPGGGEEETRAEAGSRVTRAQLEERQPRSAPDALRYEPGVSVQQTAHGQASPYVRGMTGQQVVHLFDGVRLNNGIYRQGPNQYFFTVDARILHHLDVVRGSASTLYGSDALGGAILAAPMEAPIDPELRGVRFYPRLAARVASADHELGGRLELGASLGPRTAILVGGGYRDVDRLTSGGVVSGEGGRRALVPRFEEELEGAMDPSLFRRQLGTGFEEATFDARIEQRLDGGLRLVAATYGYRQHDAPRTDQCPPPEAPADECLSVVDQRRTLTYVALRGEGRGAMRDVDLTLSYQQHHERRRRDRPRSRVRFDWLDVVRTLGLDFRAATPPAALGQRGALRLRYGVSAYRDGISSSEASQTLTDIDITQELSRGQYVAGSIYASLAAFAELEVAAFDRLVVRGGGRTELIGVRTPPDAESGTLAVEQDHATAVGRVGVEVRPHDGLAVVLNVDQGFRAPNLDDLTSRQQTGPGFQFENAGLDPERTTTFELGVRGDADWVRVDGWAFATLLSDAIVRTVRTAEECPPSTPQCGASRVRLQLVNADGRAVLLGAEGGATFYLPADVTLRATVAYAWGEGPDVIDPEAGELVPLSRVPPVNGTVEARWRHIESGLYFGAALRWAGPQHRLAPTDASDARIPVGGTPGYAVVDLRAGYRLGSRLALSVVFENVSDAAYRVHGSSINGPGRGVIVALSGGL